MKLQILGTGFLFATLSFSIHAEPVKVLENREVKNCKWNRVPERKLEILKCDIYDDSKNESVEYTIAPSRSYWHLSDEELRGTYSNKEIAEFVKNAELNNAGPNKVNLDVFVGARGIVGVSATVKGSLHSNGSSTFINTDVLSEKEQLEHEEVLKK